jgi:hypothetical protein
MMILGSPIACILEVVCALPWWKGIEEPADVGADRIDIAFGGLAQ